ncbi:hypothetical protein HBI25_121700 [Parastagonospora nodorum]|nr:hypothetical protein HBH52_098010 [Parastagonospora nodorum]KAH4900862.1 hypothetical protein HBI80_151680 [Parastagonospora nodorum]KAH5472368.1 hypothetical protein HBI28_133580 [Parastagonospora nodorum]KAH5558805.1 hypothetical protein HBI25_121700 [Parastagonospora nodorum]KAH5629119.1 hypothetical protein HBI22_129490 [Parastagonospora nodorum]
MCGKCDRIAQSYSDYATSLVRESAVQGFNKSIDNAIEDLVQVRKVVCFGLGSLRFKEDLTSCLNQHFFAFHIASRLNAVRNEHDGNVRVLLQDLGYTPLDKLLLAEGYTGGQLGFVCEPDGLLEIDEHTMVIGIYLPMYFPLLQICADIARPVAIITDRVKADTKKSKYSWRDRDSPRVARMLENYECFQELGGPYRLRDQEGTNLDDSNWLYRVQMWLRNNAAVEKEQDTETEDVGDS